MRWKQASGRFYNIKNIFKMPLSSNKKISRKAKILPQFSTYSGNKPPLDLLEIQRKSFCDLLERGIIDELSKTNTFRETAKFSGFTQQLELVLNPDTYKLVSPNCTPKEAILKGKTYACKLYVQATLTIRFSPRGSAGSVREERETEKQPSVVPRFSQPKVAHNEKNSIHLVETTKKSQFFLKTSMSNGKLLRYLQSLQLVQPRVSWTPSSGSRKRLPIDPPLYTIHDAQDMVVHQRCIDLKGVVGVQRSKDVNVQCSTPFAFFSVQNHQPTVELTDSCTGNAKIALKSFARQQCIQNVARAKLFNSMALQHKIIRESNLLCKYKEIQEKAAVSARLPYHHKAHSTDSYASFAKFPLVETPAVWNDVTYKGSSCEAANTKFCDKKENKKWNRVNKYPVLATPLSFITSSTSFDFLPGRPLANYIGDNSCKACKSRKEFGCNLLSKYNEYNSLCKLNNHLGWFYTCFVFASFQLLLRSKEAKLTYEKGGSLFAAHPLHYTPSPIFFTRNALAQDTMHPGCKDVKVHVQEDDASHQTFRKLKIQMQKKSWCETGLVRAFKFISPNNVHIVCRKQPFSPAPFRGSFLMHSTSLIRSGGPLATNICVANRLFIKDASVYVHSSPSAKKQQPDTNKTDLIWRLPKAAFAPPVNCASAPSLHFNKSTPPVNSDQAVTQRVKIFRPWIFLGELPLMTKRGHFILNGSPRVIVNQMARCPGIYFQEKRRGVGFDQEVRVSADLIPQRGPWLRIQSDWEGRFWARLKREGRVKYATLYEAFQEFEKQYSAPIVSLITNSSSSFPKSEILAFQERKVKEDRQKKALVRFFKNSTRYSLGKQGRLRINQRVHSSQPESYGCLLDSLNSWHTQESFPFESTGIDESNSNSRNSDSPVNVQRLGKGSELELNSFALRVSNWAEAQKDNEELHKFWSSFLSIRSPFQRLTNLLSIENVRQFISLRKPNSNTIFSVNSNSNLLGKLTSILSSRELNSCNRICALARARAPLVQVQVQGADTKQDGRADEIHNQLKSKISWAERFDFLSYAPIGVNQSTDSLEISSFPESMEYNSIHSNASLPLINVQRLPYRTRAHAPALALAPKVHVHRVCAKEDLLMAIDINAIHICLEHLLEGQGFTDDIDHLKNRLVRTSGKLLQQQLQLGLDRLNEVMTPLLGNLIQGQLLSSFLPSQDTEKSSLHQGRAGKMHKKKNTRRVALSHSPSDVPLRGKEQGNQKESNERAERESFNSLKFTLPEVSLSIEGGESKLQQVKKIGNQLYGPTELVKNQKQGGAKPQFPSIIDSAPHTVAVCIEDDFAPRETVKMESSADKVNGKQVIFAKQIASHVIDQLSESSRLALHPKATQEKKESRLRMSSSLQQTPFRWLRTSKPVNNAFREFFGSNPLSQYMDQTNPLAEITHKRRLSSMGPGGIKRETAGMEVRGIHPTHYGRVCPIETPEGKNAGLVNSPTVYGRIGKNGFMETPLYQVVERQVQKERWAFFSAQQEEIEESSLATGDTGVTRFNFLSHMPIPVQTANNPLAHFQQVSRNRVGYKALSPVQTISIATALIPFLEHDDANRALMGSNMQRQAIPLLSPERPIVGTGFEPMVMSESGQAIQATKMGCVSHVSANKIILESVYSKEAPPIVRSCEAEPPNSLMCIKDACRVPLGYSRIQNGDSISNTYFKFFYTKVALSSQGNLLSKYKRQKYNNVLRSWWNRTIFTRYICSANCLEPPFLFKVGLPPHPSESQRMKWCGGNICVANRYIYGVNRVSCKANDVIFAQQIAFISNQLIREDQQTNNLCTFTPEKVWGAKEVLFIQKARQKRLRKTTLCEATYNISFARDGIRSAPTNSASLPPFRAKQMNLVSSYQPLCAQIIGGASTMERFFLNFWSFSKIFCETPKTSRGFKVGNYLVSESDYVECRLPSATLWHVKNPSRNSFLNSFTKLTYLKLCWGEFFEGKDQPNGFNSSNLRFEKTHSTSLLWSGGPLATNICVANRLSIKDASVYVQRSAESELERGEKMGSKRQATQSQRIKWCGGNICVANRYIYGVNRVSWKANDVDDQMFGFFDSPSDVSPRSASRKEQANLYISKKIPHQIATNLHLCSTQSAFLFKKVEQSLQLYQRSNQETCLSQRPLVREGDWVKKGDFLADCSASHSGDLALGKNVTVAYMPWEGYNFEDAIVISDRLVANDIYTSIHIERYEIKVSKNSQGKERITNQIPSLSSQHLKHLDPSGIARVSSWVQPGDILVGKVVELKRPLSPYERLAWELASRLSPNSPEREKWLSKVWLEDISLRLPAGVCGRVINFQIISTEWSEKEHSLIPLEVHVYLAVKRKIQVGDKLAGRHGNKGIVSIVLPRQDMPYLADGSSVDMVLNPLGVPSRMNLGQIFECLLGLAGSQLGCNFKVTPFDEIAGGEASRSLVFLKLYQCRLIYKQQWLFTPTFPGKNKLFDGRTGEPFENWVTVGQAYMLKLIHMVDHKIHARSTGPYSLFTRQPVRGRSRRGGQRLGEMEVWAVEGFGAAYTLQEFLTIKSDDLKARAALQRSFYKKNDITLGKVHISPGNPEAFRVLVSELQALCLHIQM